MSKPQSFQTIKSGECDFRGPNFLHIPIELSQQRKKKQQQQKTKTDAISFPCLPQKKAKKENKTKQDETKEKVSRRSRSPRYVNDVAD